MSDPSQDLPHDTRLPTLLRRLLAATESTEQSGLHLDAGDLGPAPPIPESPDVLKVLIDEARSFMNALEPVRKNFRVLVRLLERFKGVDAVPEQEAGFLQKLAANNREKILNLGPAIYGIMPFVEWDQESARVPRNIRQTGQRSGRRPRRQARNAASRQACRRGALCRTYPGSLPAPSGQAGELFRAGPNCRRKVPRRGPGSLDL